ncbi:MAG: biopolymer transporter ExbD [Melioribacteraceae bacterium]|nr:biopolymer transporter ExbD [Melioribacteraceae bacterium]
MGRGSYLLRFVDVVLILLFGFIVISDIDEDSQIVLPSSSETERFEPGAEIILFIGITSDGEYIDERENIILKNENQLRNYISKHKNKFGELAKVRIRANYDSQAQYAITAAQICDDIQVKKAIDVKLIGN